MRGVKESDVVVSQRPVWKTGRCLVASMYM
jgi:hypothetical protein